jgi:LacI family transcriptional regulator
LQASQQEWDIFIEEDFRARIENIREWLGDGVIADYDDPEIERLLADVEVPIVGVGAPIIAPNAIPRCTTLRRITPRWSKAPSCI